MRTRVILVLLGRLAAILLAAASVTAQEKYGSVVPYASESPHPYGLGSDERPVVWQERVITRDDARLLGIHFTGFWVAPGDYLTIAGPNGSMPESYEAAGPNGDGEFWAYRGDSNEAVLTLHGGSYPGYGYRIDYLAQLSLVPVEEVTSDAGTANCVGFADVACYKEDAQFWAGQRSVAYVWHLESGTLALREGTGWLIKSTKGSDGEERSVVITNSHVFTTDQLAKEARIFFDEQRPECDKGESKPWTTEVTNVLERNSAADYDYLLLQLKDKPPADKYPPLQASTKAIKEGQVITIPEHPSGLLKKAGYYENPTEKDKVRCKVTKVGGNFQANAVFSKCPAKKGSSGSPMIDATPVEKQAVPFAIVLVRGDSPPGSGCAAGTMMSAVCKDDASKAKVLDCAQ